MPIQNWGIVLNQLMLIFEKSSDYKIHAQLFNLHT